MNVEILPIEILTVLHLLRLLFLLIIENKSNFQTTSKYSQTTSSSQIKSHIVYGIKFICWSGLDNAAEITLNTLSVKKKSM